MFTRRPWLPILLALIAPAFCAAQTNPDLRDEKLQAIAAIEKEMAGLPSLGEHDLGEVLRFTVRGGKIHPVTGLHLHGLGEQRITIQSMPGVAKVNLLSTRAFNAAGENEFLQFFYRDVSDPRTVSVYTEVQCNADSVQVSQWAGLAGDGVRSVQFMQADADGPEAVSLYIQWFTAAGPKVHVHLLGSSLADLAQSHPAEINQFVRPVFRLLRQEQTVFQVDSKTAYQALADLCTTDAATAATTDAAVAGLGADAFTDREAAAAKLRALGEPAAIYLMRARPGTLGAEQSMRVDMFLTPYRPLSEEQVQRLRKSPDFLLDCLFNPNTTIRGLAVRRLGAVAGTPIQFDTSLQDQPLETAVSALRARLAAAPK